MVIYHATIYYVDFDGENNEHSEYGADRDVLESRMVAERQRIAPGEWRCGCQKVGEVEYICYIEEITLVC